MTGIETIIKNGLLKEGNQILTKELKRKGENGSFIIKLSKIDVKDETKNRYEIENLDLNFKYKNFTKKQVLNFFA